jgi:hypothetical protein
MEDAEKNVVVDQGESASAAADGQLRDSSGAVMKTVETWATEKGMLPQFIGGAEGRVPPGAPTDMAGNARIAMSGLTGPTVNPKYVRFARAKLRWPESKEVTEAEFDKAVVDAESHICR